MKRVLICLAALFVLTGCEMLPFARELESTMLVQVLGIDWTQEEVTLTGANDPGTGEATLLSASGRSMDEAKNRLKGMGEEYVSLTHVRQLILGEQTDLAAVLDAALKEPALGQSATVWMCEEGSAKDLMEGVSGGGKRLSSIELNSGVSPVTVLQSLMRLEETGQVEIPLLAADGQMLVPAGTYLVQGEYDEQ